MLPLLLGQPLKRQQVQRRALVMSGRNDGRFWLGEDVRDDAKRRTGEPSTTVATLEANSTYLYRNALMGLLVSSRGSIHTGPTF